jgi:small ligand-binding sensory domain FIST
VPFAAALSAHPNAAHAVGEVTGQVLEALGDEPPDLAVLFVTGPHVRAAGDAGEVVRRLLQPRTLIGCTAVSVLANGLEVEETPAVTLWAGRFGQVHGVAIGPDGGVEDPPPFEPSALVLLADPFGFPAEIAFAALAERWPHLPVVGGMASAARGPGGNRLLLDDRALLTGAVGAFLGPGVEVETIVSQGCRPVGRPYTVTAAEENVVRELGGEPAMQRLLDLANDELTEDEVAVINGGGLHIGLVIDERNLEFQRGDFLVRNVLGANQAEGWIAMAEPVDLGAILQFHLRDAESADDDLRAMLNGRRADAALVFTCKGRGTNLFAEAHHDAGVVADYLGRPPAAGMFCAGEFGPVGGRNFVHGFTASIALFREPGRMPGWAAVTDSVG